MKNKTKTLGQIYTPVKIVNQMLDLINYQGEQILSKHIIDNSCGNGAFLLVIVDRYVKEYKKKYNNLFNIEKHLDLGKNW